MTTIRLWDLSVRLIHWSFVLLLPALWWTGEEGDLERHKTVGLVMLGLVAFRILWGLVGSATARFGSFVRGPGAVLAYLRGEAAQPGHNPIGGLSVVLMLLLLAGQAGFGLFAQDVDGMESGPLSYLVSYEQADAAREWHHLGFDLILIVVGLHIAAILFYRFVKRDNLMTPMITGRRSYDTAVQEPRMAPAWLAAACAIAAAAFAWWIAKGAPLP